MWNVAKKFRVWWRIVEGKEMWSVANFFLKNIYWVTARFVNGGKMFCRSQIWTCTRNYGTKWYLILFSKGWWDEKSTRSKSNFLAFWTKFGPNFKICSSKSVGFSQRSLIKKMNLNRVPQRWWKEKVNRCKLKFFL